MILEYVAYDVRNNFNESFSHKSPAWRNKSAARWRVSLYASLYGTSFSEPFASRRIKWKKPVGSVSNVTLPNVILRDKRMK